MAKQPRKTISRDQEYFMDGLEFFELIHFIVRGARYWISSGLIFFFLAIIYVVTLYPSNLRQQTINDIGLDQESLNLVRQIMPAMTGPLEGKMQAEGLESLYSRITKGGQDYLDKTIFGISGVDLKDKSLDSLTKGKIETVVIRIKGDEKELAKREIDFIRNNIKGISQYLAVKKYIDDEIIDARINLFNAEAEVNHQALKHERASRQILAYKRLEEKTDKVKDMQIILNLSNSEDSKVGENIANDITEFSGAKYLPLANRILALKSEMADRQEAQQIAQLQIDALKLSQKVLNHLVVTFEATPYQGDAINFSPMIQVVQGYRQQKTDYTREEVAALDNLERQLIAFDRSGFRFSNSLPMEIEKKGSKTLILIGGFIGAILGFLFYAISRLFDAYRRRYKN